MKADIESLAACAFDLSNDRSSRVKALEEIIYDDTSNSLVSEAGSAALYELDASNRLAKSWKEFSSERDLPELSTNQIRVTGKLYHLQRNWSRAYTSFKEIVDRHEADDRDLLLAVYAIEGVIRRTRNASLFEVGIELLDQVSNELEAEKLHCEGHLRSALASTQGTVIEADLSRSKLLEAAKRDGSYSSCWTSLGSEFGDHNRTIQDSLEFLSSEEDWLSNLSEFDRQTVRLEVLFYLAHALSATGSKSMALAFFNVFRVQLKQRLLSLEKAEDRDGLAHAELFEIETLLRGSGFVNLSTESISELTTRLRRLHFVSPFSTEMEEEKRLLLEGLEFAEQVLGDLEYPMSSLAGQAQRLTAMLSESLIDSEIRVLPTDSTCQLESEIDPANRRSISEALRHEPSCELSQQRVSLRVSVDSPKDLILVDLATPTQTSLIAQMPSLGNDNELIDGFVVPGQREAEAVEEVVRALVSFRAFLADTRYVFNIVPCVDSPAIRYQRPSWGADDLNFQGESDV